MHQQFLAKLQDDPACIPAWLVYADWLEEQGDPTGPFVRLSLQLTAGQVALEDAETRVQEFEKLYAAAHVETRELLAVYRSALPTRFRVLDRIFIGHDPPQEMFGYARTMLVGFLESGRVKVGANLGVGISEYGRPRLLAVIDAYGARHLQEIGAGSAPIQAGLGWIGHLKTEVGSVLTTAIESGPW